MKKKKISRKKPTAEDYQISKMSTKRQKCRLVLKETFSNHKSNVTPPPHTHTHTHIHKSLAQKKKHGTRRIC